MKLRALILCFAATFALTLCAGAADIVDSGTCGDNLTWTLDSDGILTISGAGAMDDWTEGNSPWYAQRRKIITAIIDDGITAISNYAFSNCSNLASVTIPHSVTSIGWYAFSRCVALTGVAIPNSVASIDIGAFYGCKSLTSVTIPDKIVNLSANMFATCSGLTYVEIPDSVVSIGNTAFYGCAGLKNITIPNSVISIGNGAFSDCTGLISVTIPYSVTTINNLAFRDCTGLTAILVDADNQCYSSEVGVLFDKNRSILLRYPPGKTGAYEIPDGVTAIGDSSFMGCEGLASVTIPDGVTNIPFSAFSKCKNLTSVTIPESVTAIGNYAFSDCTGLTDIMISASVTSIGQGAFQRCDGLTDIYYGGSVAQWSEIYIGWAAYGEVTIHHNAQDVGVEITLTDENEKIVDGNGQIEVTPEKKKDVFQDGAEFKASFTAADPDAVTSSKLVTANVFLIFYDRDGLMVSLETKEIDLSDPFNLMFVLDIHIPQGAKTLKFLMLGDNFEPLRAVRLIESSADAE